MNHQLHKKSIVNKTLQVSLATFLSRIVAIGREILQIKFFGINAVSDAFIAAFRFPNLFRHVFAEGALSASLMRMRDMGICTARKRMRRPVANEETRGGRA